MAVPWLQIVRLMPSILEVSRELLKRSRKQPASDNALVTADGEDAHGARIRALEENERKQAELVNTMADQLSQLTAAASSLHTLTRWLIGAQVVTTIVAVVALVLATRGA
jgi:hypothetical protein